MSLRRKFNSKLRQVIGCYAAWEPILQPYKIGDYGKFKNGVFEKIGNVRTNFGLNFSEESGLPTKFEMVTERVVLGDVEVEGNVVHGINAKLEFKFSSNSSFLLIGDEMTRVNMTEHVGLGKQLCEQPAWKSSYKVVRSVYRCTNVSFVGSRHAGKSAVLSGDAEVLRKIKAGEIGMRAGIQFNANDLLKFSGESGTIGLKFFKVRRHQLELEAASVDKKSSSQNRYHFDEDFGDELLDE